MAGERLDHARIGPLGIDGDRMIGVINERGRVITSRAHPRLLGHHATLGSDGQPLVDGREGRRAVEVIQAIYRSAETGRTVELH